jgi:hypothetical protein
MEELEQNHQSGYKEEERVKRIKMQTPVHRQRQNEYGSHSTLECRTTSIVWTLGEREEHTKRRRRLNRCSLLSPLAKMHRVAAGDDDDELEGWLNSLGDSDENFNFDDWMNTDLASDDELDGETSSPMRPMDLVRRMS